MALEELLWESSTHRIALPARSRPLRPAPVTVEQFFRRPLKLGVNPSRHGLIVPSIARRRSSKFQVQNPNRPDSISSKKLPINVLIRGACARCLEGAKQPLSVTARTIRARFNDSVPRIVVGGYQTFFVDGLDDERVHQLGSQYEREPA